MKILSPVGNYDSLKMAVQNGADEVYLGINDFNARNNIDGFTLDTLEQAIDYAHIHNVKVLLALNILFSDSELQSAFDTLVKAYNLGVDAFIIQDIALAKLVHDTFPQIELHASTQMGLHNLEGVRNVLPYGFTRVVLARETPLSEIHRIKEHTSVEIEYFVHGALCVSFSGNCYLSSKLFNASGNRGRCKQLCRLPFTLEKNGKKIKEGYLLSAKDFNMSSRLDELQKAGVSVLKIEGRARRPYYVATATKHYYNLLHKKNVNEDSLKLAFNRGFTDGYFSGNGNIMSQIQNHMGVYVGRVEKINIGKKFNEIYFSSNRRISPKSTLKFFDKGKEVCSLSAFDLQWRGNDKYMFTTTKQVAVGNGVHLIADAALEEEALSVSKRRPVQMEINAAIGKPIRATIHFENANLIVSGPLCQEAKNQPVTKDDIEKNFEKNEYFQPVFSKIEIGRIFLSKQQLNEFRRDVYQKVFQAIVEKSKRSLNSKNIPTSHKFESFENFQIVENIGEKFIKDNIIYSPESYSPDDVIEFQKKCVSMCKKVYLDTPNFALEDDITVLRNIIKKTNIAIIANNYYALSFPTEIVVGGGLNVYNSLAANCLGKPVMCAESSIASPVEFPLMTLRHCPMKAHLSATCDKCPYCEGYSYRMENGNSFALKRKKLSSCTFYLTNKKK